MPKLKPGTIVPTPEEDRAITAAAQSDSDNPPLENLTGFKPARGRPVGSGKKEQVTLRLDRDLLDRYRATGEGWQTRINNDLRKATDKQRSTR
ncbi:MAG: BrnA antitoxin family protein [Burkholderiaceae bacterium]